MLHDAGADRRPNPSSGGNRSLDHNFPRPPHQSDLRIPEQGALFGRRLRQRDRHRIASRRRLAGAAALVEGKVQERPAGDHCVGQPGDGHVRGLPRRARPKRRRRKRGKEVVERAREIRHLSDLVRDVRPDLRCVLTGRIEAAAIPTADEAVGVGDQLAGGGAAPDGEAVVPSFQGNRSGAVARAKLPEPMPLGVALSLGAGRARCDLAARALRKPGALELGGAVSRGFPALGRAERRQRRGEDPGRGSSGAAQASAMKG